MIKEFVEIKNEVINKKNCTLFLVTFIIASLFYSTVMSNNLTNTGDGLWNGSFYYAQEQEIMSGRWLWYYADILLQGIKAEPFITLFSLIIFSFGNVLLCELLDIEKTWLRIAISLLILLSVPVCCQLSYKHQSYAFALSYLFSIMAAFMLIKIKSNFISLLVSTLLLIFTLATYQSEIGCFCLVVIFYLIIDELKNNVEVREESIILLKAVFAVVIASLIYKIIWDTILRVNNLEINTYRGANQVSIYSILVSLPKSIINSFLYFFNYYLGRFKINIYPFITKVAFSFSIIINIFYYFYYLVFKRDFRWLTFFLFLLCPVACNFSVLYLDAGVEMQQTLPIALFLPLSLFVSYKNLQKNDRKLFEHTKIVMMAICAFVLFGNILQTEIDIESMREGKLSTDHIINLVCDSLVESDLLDTNRKYYFIGEPYRNSLFNVSELWTHANEYAQFGKFGVFGNNAWVIPKAYQAVINNNGIGIKCDYSSNEKYNEIVKMDEFSLMPCYPNDGSIKIIDDYVIIKISNSYLED